MGNWHCIPESCGRVTYREYLPPQIRYRYSNEDWIYVDGDNYKLEQPLGQCLCEPYDIRVFYTSKFAGSGEQKASALLQNVLGQITSVSLIKNYQNGFDIYAVAESNCKPNGQSNKAIVVINGSAQEYSLDAVNIIKKYGIDNCGDCTFTVTRNGEIVHQEIRDICPEVEQLPCRLSDVTKEIKIEKTPWLSKIEVIDFGKDAIKIPGNPFPTPTISAIPTECLNIYRGEIFDLLPEGDPDEPNDPVFADYIAQICSAPGCPPPEYSVICDCNSCVECPPDTCAVACDDRVCCYDTTTGKPIREIAIADYCGGAV